VLLAAGLAAGGARHAPAAASPRETPAHRIVRLRAEATKVQRTIDQMNNRIEHLVEDFNANQEALARTSARQADTRVRVDAAQAALDAAQQVLDERVRAIYVNGPVTPLGVLLEAHSVHEALTTAKYQASIVAADNAAIAGVEEAKATLNALAGELAGQREAEVRLRARLLAQRGQISARLAQQRAYLARVNRAVKRAVAEQRRIEEQRRRRALARRLAALRAARARAARRHHHRIAAGGGAAPNGAARAAVAWALDQVGKPYEWGADGPDTFDCSGLTMTAYGVAGVSLPRTSREQWDAGPHVGLADLARGDLVFFADSTADPDTIHHVALYIGRGLMVEAPFTGADVRVSSIDRPDYIGAVRPTG
jgi:peptidoglycan DL-endopeptidase CwlO